MPAVLVTCLLLLLLLLCFLPNRVLYCTFRYARHPRSLASPIESHAAGPAAATPSRRANTLLSYGA